MGARQEATEKEDAMSTPAVVYGVKSSPDEKESVADQHRIVLEAIEREDGREVIGVFGEANKSGYRKERGPQLETAMRAAVEAAAEHGAAELWVFHSSRLARGDGRKGRRSLMKVYADLLYEDVQVRSVTDDEFVRNGMLVGVASEQNAKYSADLSGHVQRGKRQAAERGESPFGSLPDGYAAERWLDERGRKQRRVVLDPSRSGVVRAILTDALKGVADAALARKLNTQAVTTRKGNPWTRSLIRDLVTNPFYCGRISYGGELFEGKHERLIEPAEFDRMMAARRARDHARDRKVKGRPAKRHALGKLAVCGHCGRRMAAFTGPHARKDGSKLRTYRCFAWDLPGDPCHRRQYEAEALDAAVLGNLGNLLPDFRAWIASVTERQSGERERLEARLELATSERDEAARTVETAERRYLDVMGTDDEQLVLGAMRLARRDLDDAGKRLGALMVALDATPAGTPTDALLDFAAALQRALRGVDTSGSMAQVNAALAEVFEAFVIHADPVTVEPVLDVGVAQAMLYELDGVEYLDTTGAPSTAPFVAAGEAPPMAWLDAMLESQTTPRRASTARPP
jgi:hypothetical protein